MEKISEYSALDNPVCLVIGNFDGVHRGHQLIIEKAKHIATRNGWKTAVLSFNPHPLKVIAPHRAPQLIQTDDEKRALLAFYGVDYYIVWKFDNQLMHKAPESFVKELKAHVDFRFLIVGKDFHFGYKRSGNVQTLHDLGKNFGFAVEGVQELTTENALISSSKIRNLLCQGNVAEAATLLNRPYFLSGTVVRGDQLGNKLNTPTANLASDHELLPKFGVYASWTRLDQYWYRSITNIGVRPTFQKQERRIETHLFGYSGNLYEQQLLLCLTDFLREEQAFDSPDSLRRQIMLDCKKRLAMIDSMPPAFPLLLNDGGTPP